MDLAYIVLTMTGPRLRFSCLLAGLHLACGSGSANVVGSASLGSESAKAEADVTSSGGKGQAGSGARASAAAGGTGTVSAEGAPAPEPSRPAYDPELVRAAIDRTSAPADARERLGLRLAIVEQGPDAPWLVAVVNRGSEPLHVLFDLRTLSLEVQPKAPEQDSTSKTKRAAKPPKPIVCGLPKD